MSRAWVGRKSRALSAGSKTGFAKDQLVLVTGSTDGIGKAVARLLCERGAHLIVHGRSREKAVSVQREIEAATGHRPELIIADFNSLRQVRVMADEIHLRFPWLKILINNAGIYSARHTFSEDGFEQTFQVNYLAAFLLTLLLSDLLRANAKSRIVNVTSMLHLGAKLDPLHPQGQGAYDGHEAYARSKLELVLFTRELATRLFGTGVTVNACHPGGVATKLAAAGWGADGISPEQGALTPVFLADEPGLAQVSGRYFEGKMVSSPDPRAHDPVLRRKLWDRTQELLGAQQEKAA